MPYATNPVSSSYTPSDPLPQHLEHKPIYALPYEQFDGRNPNRTDARYVTIGIAQYDKDEVSIKVMRHTGTKWSRQAEELPLHRVIDMTLFLAKVLFDSKDAVIHIPGKTFKGQDNDIEITREQCAKAELTTYKEFLTQDGNGQFLRERLNALLKTLNDLKGRGKI